MLVKILFFATYREKVGGKQIEVELPDDMRVANFKSWLIERYPQLAGAQGSMLVAVDKEFVLEDDFIHGSEIAVFPPVSGGMHD